MSISYASIMESYIIEDIACEGFSLGNTLKTAITRFIAFLGRIVAKIRQFIHNMKTTRGKKSDQPRKVVGTVDGGLKSPPDSDKRQNHESFEVEFPKTMNKLRAQSDEWIRSVNTALRNIERPDASESEVMAAIAAGHALVSHASKDLSVQPRDNDVYFREVSKLYKAVSVQIEDLQRVSAKVHRNLASQYVDVSPEMQNKIPNLIKLINSTSEVLVVLTKATNDRM